MGDKRWLHERWFDQLLEYRPCHFEIFVIFANFRSQFDRARAAFTERHLEPIGAGFFANQVFVTNPSPGRGEVNGARDFSFGVLMLDLQGSEGGLRNMANERLDEF